MHAAPPRPLPSAAFVPVTNSARASGRPVAMGRLPGNRSRAEARSLGDNVVSGSRVRQQPQARSLLALAPTPILHLPPPALWLQCMSQCMGLFFALHACAVRRRGACKAFRKLPPRAAHQHALCPVHRPDSQPACCGAPGSVPSTSPHVSIPHASTVSTLLSQCSCTMGPLGAARPHLFSTSSPTSEPANKPAVARRWSSAQFSAAPKSTAA